MSSLARRLACSAAMSAMLIGGQPAVAETDSGSSILAPANIAGGVLRSAISYARMVADIRYGAMEIDAQRGTIVLRDLHVAGIGDAERCRVDLGRMQISGITFWAVEDMRARIDIADLTIANNCFGPKAAMIGMVTGTDMIAVERLSLNVHQHSGSGATQMDLEAVSPGIARISGSADFDYFALYIPDAFKKLAEGEDAYGLEPDAPTENMGEGPPEPENDDPEMGVRGTLRAAHVSVENLGVWERIQPLLPPDATTPEAFDAMVTAEPGTPVRNAQEGLAAALKAFVAQPGMVTAEIRPAAPVVFDSEGWQAPGDAIGFFAPVFTNARPSPPVKLIADPSAAGDARSLGLALARGDGVPRNHRRAIGLLSPIKGDAEVSLALATMIVEADPAAAYPHAMAAANLDAPGAPAMLDMIEAKLPTAALLTAQQPASAPLPDESFASVQALRDAALAREQGDGVPRSYALAWRLAASAAAAGDGASEALMARLNARFGGEPVWITAREAAADAAMADWTSRKLGTALAATPQ